MGWISSVIGAVGGAAGGVADKLFDNYLGKKSQSRQNSYNRYMTSTAHQTEVNDLRAAGLNPVLSALGNGAAVHPVSGTSVGDGNLGRDTVQAGINAFNARTAAQLNKEQVELSKEQQQTEQSQRDLNSALAWKAHTDATLNSAKAQGETVKSGIELMKSDYLKSLSPALRDAVINAILTGSGSSLFGSIYQSIMDAGGSSYTHGIKPLVDSVSGNSNESYSHSSASQMKIRLDRVDDGYAERKAWYENLKRDLEKLDKKEKRKVKSD